jgi:hypothetical protein
MMSKITQVAAPKVGVGPGNSMSNLNVGAGVVGKEKYPETKTSGITVRGCGAATKGTKARGPMA